jgi:hypothetical protein
VKASQAPHFLYLRLFVKNLMNLKRQVSSLVIHRPENIEMIGITGFHSDLFLKNLFLSLLQIQTAP